MESEGPSSERKMKPVLCYLVDSVRGRENKLVKLEHVKQKLTTVNYQMQKYVNVMPRGRTRHIMLAKYREIS